MRFIKTAAKVSVATQNVAHTAVEGAKKVPGKTGEAKVGFGQKLSSMKEEYKAAVDGIRNPVVVADPEVVETEIIFGFGNTRSTNADAMLALGPVTNEGGK